MLRNKNLNIVKICSDNEPRSGEVEDHLELLLTIVLSHAQILADAVKY